MVDKAVFALADKGDKLEAEIKAQFAKMKVARDAEIARALKANAELGKLQDELNRMQGEFSRCGAARLAIAQAVPSSITQALGQAEAEVRQHLASLESAERVHLAHVDARKATVSAPGFDGKSPPGKRTLEDYERGIAGAKKRVDDERERIDGFKARVTKFEGERDAFLKELRANAHRANGKTSG